MRKSRWPDEVPTGGQEKSPPLTVKSARVVYDDHDTNLGSCF
jgi:hypothetical protein